MSVMLHDTLYSLKVFFIATGIRPNTRLVEMQCVSKGQLRRDLRSAYHRRSDRDPRY